MRKIEKLEIMIEALQQRLDRTNKLVKQLLLMHNIREVIPILSYPSGWSIDVVDDNNKLYTYDFLESFEGKIHPRLDNCNSIAKTETAGSVTFDELAKLIVDGEPIKREKVETQYYDCKCSMTNKTVVGNKYSGNCSTKGE